MYNVYSLLNIYTLLDYKRTKQIFHNSLNMYKFEQGELDWNTSVLRMHKAFRDKCIKGYCTGASRTCLWFLQQNCWEVMHWGIIRLLQHSTYYAMSRIKSTRHTILKTRINKWDVTTIAACLWTKQKLIQYSHWYQLCLDLCTFWYMAPMWSL